MSVARITECQSSGPDASLRLQRSDLAHQSNRQMREREEGQMARVSSSSFRILLVVVFVFVRIHAGVPVGVEFIEQIKEIIFSGLVAEGFRVAGYPG